MCAMESQKKKAAKWRDIFKELKNEIGKGVYSDDNPLPSEKRLGLRYGVSRITVVRALDELCHEGLVERVRGSGTYPTRLASASAGRLGLIFPDLAMGEIFPLIFQELMRCAQRDGYTFVFGDIASADAQTRAHKACDVARMFVRQRVAGVVLQPLAFLKTPERVTREIVSLFREAKIPVVLMDRNVETDGVACDFVGIDNLAAGRALGAHLVERGARRIHFLMRPNCASVIRDRLDGVFSALGERRPKDCAIVAEPTDEAALAKVFGRRGRPDAVVCESDFVATQLRATLEKLGLSVPRDVRLAGFDDVRCASVMTPSLTTVHQPCEDLARTAYQTLVDRLRDPSLPVRRILLPAPLVVRDSTR